MIATSKIIAKGPYRKLMSITNKFCASEMVMLVEPLMNHENSSEPEYESAKKHKDVPLLPYENES